MPGDFSGIPFHELDVPGLFLRGRFDTLNVSCTTEGSKSTGSPPFLGRASAIMRFVGAHQTNEEMSWQLSLMITTSMLVRLSSMEVGEEGECK